MKTLFDVRMKILSPECSRCGHASVAEYEAGGRPRCVKNSIWLDKPGEKARHPCHHFVARACDTCAHYGLSGNAPYCFKKCGGIGVDPTMVDFCSHWKDKDGKAHCVKCTDCNAYDEDNSGPFCLAQNKHIEPALVGKDIPCPTFKAKVHPLVKCIDCVSLEMKSPRPICHAHLGRECDVDIIETPMPCQFFNAKSDFSTKPPLGVMREDLWIEDRVWELIRGLHDRRAYILKTDCKTDPHLIGKWLDELARLLPLIRGMKI